MPVLTVCSRRLVRRIEGNQMESMYLTCSSWFDNLQKFICSSVLPHHFKRRKCTVSIEGNIGAGKTVLLEHFKNSPIIEVLPEPVHKWRNIQGHNALGLMYEDPCRWSLTFQTYVQLTMLQSHMQRQDKPVRLLERSIFSAKYCFVENLYRSGKMPDVEYTVLTEWFDWIIKTQNVDVDLIVYLQTSPETVYERIKNRSRKEETKIPMDYLERLHNLHEDWLIHHRFPVPCPVLVLDGNHDLSDMKSVYEDKKHEILCGYAS